MVDVQQAQMQRAGLTALGLFAFLVVLLYSRLPSVLPNYPAVIVAFASWCVLPGWFLQRALFSTKATGLVERVAVAFLMSMAVASVPGLIGLRLHWSIEGFGLAYAAVAAVASGVLLIIRSPQADMAEAGHVEPEEPASSSGPFPSAALLALIAIPLLAILTSPWWEGGRIARDADDLVYAAYVVEYHDNGLDAAEPFADTRRGQFGRMQFNVWVVVQGLLAQSAGVEALSLLLTYLPPIMTLLVVAAMFVIAKGLFRNKQIALLACGLLLLYGALDLSPHEGFGRNIFLRIGEDKMVASFILLPVGLLLSARYLERGGARPFVATLPVIAALFVTHPMALMFLGAVIAVLAILRVSSDRSTASLARNGLLLAPWAVAAVGMYLSAVFGAGRVDHIGETFRRSFHIVDLSGSQIVGNYHLILHPFVFIAVSTSFVLWILSRRQLGNQVLLASVLASLAIMFVPPVATVLAETVTEEVVWRAQWIMLVPLAIACGLYELTSRIPRTGLQLGGISLSRQVAPVLVLLAVCAGTFLVQEQYAIVDNGAFYNRTSDTSLLPWTGGSIFLGGVERAFSSEWKPKPADWQVLKYLEENAPPGATILGPGRVTRYFPGLFPLLHTVAEYQRPDTAERFKYVRLFEEGQLTRSEIIEGLRRFSVDFVITRNLTVQDDAMRTFATFTAGAFEQQLGTPELTTGRSGQRVFEAWALGADLKESVGGVTFTVPQDIDPDQLTLDIDVIAAPSSTIQEAAVARLVVSFAERLGDGSEDGSSVAVIRLPVGTEAGEWILRRRFRVGTVKPGGTYTVSVARDVGADADTYDADIWLVSVRVKYWPDYSLRIGETKFHVFDFSGGVGALDRPDG